MTSFINQLTWPIIHESSSIPFLMQKTIEAKRGKLGPHGEMIIMTGKHTGRSADDKYVVKNEVTEKTIWWDNNIHPMSDEMFFKLKFDVLKYMNDQKEIFCAYRSLGNADHFNINLELLSTEPNASHFAQFMFKDKSEKAQEEFKILHAPYFKFDPNIYGTRTSTVIVTCFKDKTSIILGTHYAGEIKKCMFSIMNYLLPDKKILPMHSGACKNHQGDSVIFFGLSGTGKTTLSTDKGTILIGDDEHGLSKKGIFNFENGCYAKTFKLSEENEPGIYEASTQFTSYLENVTLASDQLSIDFMDGELTENGRSSYPLTFIKDRDPSGTGTIPKNIFFLSADAFGVLPAISKLTHEEAKKYFILGYTAKLAGTEIGVKAPAATFSPCFGAPFMLLHPKIYAQLLDELITQNQINVWLVNTGWYGGAYGKGERIPLAVTREIIRAVSNHELTNADFEKNDVFGHLVPKKIRDINPKFLNPILSWSSKEEYMKEAKQLKLLFLNELKKFI